MVENRLVSIDTLKSHLFDPERLEASYEDIISMTKTVRAENMDFNTDVWYGGITPIKYNPPFNITFVIFPLLSRIFTFFHILRAYAKLESSYPPLMI